MTAEIKRCLSINAFFMKNFIPIFLFIIIFPVFSFSGDSLKINQMTLYFQSDTGNKKFIAYIKKDLISRLKLLNDFYGIFPSKTYKIYLLEDKGRFNNFSKNDLPEWSSAIAYIKSNTIILKINSAEDVIESSKTLVHELSHLLLYHHFNRKYTPVWINEGLAEYMAGKDISVSEKTIIANALWANTLISLTRIDSLLTFNGIEARLAYLESFSAVSYFIHKHGMDSLYLLLGNISNTNNINHAFLKTVGYDFIDFELDWYNELEDKYIWLIILNLDNLIWISITILAITVFISIKIRNKKKIDNWNVSDEYEY